MLHVRRRRIECSPCFGDEDLSSFPNTHFPTLEDVLVAEGWESLDNHLDEVQSRSLSMVSSLKLGQETMERSSESLKLIETQFYSKKSRLYLAQYGTIGSHDRYAFLQQWYIFFAATRSSEYVGYQTIRTENL